MIFLCYLSLLYNVTFCFVSIFIYLPIIECFVNAEITFYHVNNIFESNSLNIKCHKHEIYSQINEYGVKKNDELNFISICIKINYNMLFQLQNVTVFITFFTQIVKMLLIQHALSQMFSENLYRAL